jgi:hypothetical protein
MVIPPRAYKAKKADNMRAEKKPSFDSTQIILDPNHAGLKPMQLRSLPHCESKVHVARSKDRVRSGRRLFPLVEEER